MSSFHSNGLIPSNRTYKLTLPLESFYSHFARFTLAPALHDHDELVDDEFDQVIYEIDSEDEEWLEAHGTKFAQSDSGLHLADDGSVSVAAAEGDVAIASFEWMIQWFEKEAFVQQQKNDIIASRHTVQYDDTPCSVCRLKESTDLNQIVICDGCEISVHQQCYGCRSIPDGAWLCDPCSQNLLPSNIICALCGRQEGAFKPIESTPSSSADASDSTSTKPATIQRRRKDATNWAHVQCALWLSHAEMTSKDCGGFVRILPSTKLERHHSPCMVCSKSLGDTVKCQKNKCNAAFHVTCGQKKCFAIIRDDDGKCHAWCDQHTPDRYIKWRKEQLVTTARQNLQRKRKRKRSKDNPLLQFSWAVSSRRSSQGTPSAEALKYWGGLVVSTSVPDMLGEYAQAFPRKRRPSEKLAKLVFEHWTRKRRRLRGAPLLKNFHPSNVVGNASVLLNLTPSKNLPIVFSQLLRVRNSLTQLLQLAALIVKREHMKRLELMSKVRLYENMLSPSRGAQLHVLQTVSTDFDQNQRFLSSATLQHPLDWSVILQNIHIGTYDADAQAPGGGSFFADLERVVDPAAVPPPLRLEAVRIRDKLDLLKQGNAESIERTVHPLSIVIPRSLFEQTINAIAAMQQNPSWTH